jgi:hypothetical protein
MVGLLFYTSSKPPRREGLHDTAPLFKRVDNNIHSLKCIDFFPGKIKRDNISYANQNAITWEIIPINNPK